MGTDIWGNPDNRDVHGNSMDRDIHGNQPMDIHGNPWGGGSSAPSGWGSGSSSSSSAGASAFAGDPASGGSLGTWSGGGSSGTRPDPSAIHVLAGIGILMIGAGLVASFFAPTIVGIQPTRVAIAGLILFLIGTFPKAVGLLLAVGCGFALYEAGATPAGWSRAGIPTEVLAIGIIGTLLGIGLIVSAVTPTAAWKQKGRHRTMVGLVVLPVAALVILTVVFAPTRSRPMGQTGVPAIVTASTLNFRASPMPTAALIGTVSRGDTLMITGEERNGWIPVVHARRRGYVSAQYLARLAMPADSALAR